MFNLILNFVLFELFIIRVYFQSLVADSDVAYAELPPPSLVSPPAAKYGTSMPGMRPLSITIPNTNDNYEASPPNSPTGTIRYRFLQFYLP